MEKLNLGIIGCGATVRCMFGPILKYLENGRLVAVMDPQESQAKWAKDMYGAQEIYTDLNGKLEGTLEQSGDIVINPDINPAIGADKFRNIEWFNGIIDEVVIYKRALSSEEILLLMEDSVKRAASVEPEGKLATSWGDIKARH